MVITNVFELIKTKDIHKLAALEDGISSELEQSFHKERWELLLKMSKLYKQQRKEIISKRNEHKKKNIIVFCVFFLSNFA